MFHSVIVASKGRGEILRETVLSFLAQSVPADEIIISVTGEADLPHDGFPGEIQALYAPMGVTRQINAAVGRTDPRCDIVSIFDDDVELSPDYFANVQRLFSEHPEIVCFDGNPVASGVHNHDDAREILQSSAGARESTAFAGGHSLWGCNMNIRRWVLDREKFDESLPLYGWLFDIEFGCRVAELGKFGRYNACRFIHLEVPQGRISGIKHGFSQIMNPIHLYKKRVMVKSLRDLVFGHLLKVVAVNLYWLLRRDKRIDRYGRLKGNFLAIYRALIGKTDPRQVETVA